MNSFWFSILTAAAALPTCASHPCENGGTCIEYTAAFQCRCTNDFTGLRCEVPVSSTGELNQNCLARSLAYFTTYPSCWRNNLQVINKFMFFMNFIKALWKNSFKAFSENMYYNAKTLFSQKEKAGDYLIWFDFNFFLGGKGVGTASRT